MGNNFFTMGNIPLMNEYIYFMNYIYFVLTEHYIVGCFRSVSQFRSGYVPRVPTNPVLERLNQFSPFRYFTNFAALFYRTLVIEDHVYI